MQLLATRPKAEFGEGRFMAESGHSHSFPNQSRVNSALAN
jgi:hypothetical protein